MLWPRCWRFRCISQQLCHFHYTPYFILKMLCPFQLPSSQFIPVHFTAVWSSYAVPDWGDTEFLSDEAEEAVHPCDITEWPAHCGDLEGFYNHCGWGSRPARENAGICPWHFLGPAGGHCPALPPSRWVMLCDWLNHIWTLTLTQIIVS